MKRARERFVSRALASILLAIFAFSGVVFGSVQVARAIITGPDNVFAYQGRLLNNNGVPVADATASMSFSLYTAVSGGTCLWSNDNASCGSGGGTPERTITLTDGLFTVNLGDTNDADPYDAIPDTVFNSDRSIYLAVTVNGETLSPRKLITATPFAVNANLLDGFDTVEGGGAVTYAIPVFDEFGTLHLAGNPQGSSADQGVLGINPSALFVDANDTLFDVSVSSTQRFAVDKEGDTTILGDLGVNGGDLTSSAGTFNLLNSVTSLNINDAAVTSTIDIGGVDSSGQNTVNIATNSTAADEINIGNSNASTHILLTSGSTWSISLDGSITTEAVSTNATTNVLTLGDGVSDSNNPSILFRASDGADSGTLSYLDADTFDFSGGNIAFTGLGTIPSTSSSASGDFTATSSFGGTSGNNLSTTQIYGGYFNSSYSATEGTGSTAHTVAAANGNLSISGASTTLTYGYGVNGSVTNTSTNASLLDGGRLTAVNGVGTQNAAATISAVEGTRGTVIASAGTISTAVGVRGEIVGSGGTVTSGYGAIFANSVTGAGTTRYGVYAEASGGTTNYAGYFASAGVQIDTDGIADTPTYANGAGDLFVSDAIESDGSLYVGDASATDVFAFSSGATTGTAATWTVSALTSGIGMNVTRGDDGTATVFDGTVASFNSYDTSGGNGDVVNISNLGGTGSVGLYISQNTLSAHSANATGNNALVIDVNETSGSEDVMMIRSDADGTPDTEFRVESDGDVFGDGATYNAGADYAEFFKTSDSGLGAYAVVCQDTAMPEAVRRCAAGETAGVMGVVSTNAAFVGNNFYGASVDMSTDPSYRKIGMVGQIDTLVNAAEGAISIGDPITASATLSGYGAKAHGPSRIVGFALESLSSGTGMIRVLVQPQWYGGDVLTSDGGAIVSGADIVLAPMRTATVSTSGDSQDVALRGSGWNGVAPVTKTIALRNTVLDGADEYRLSVVNDDNTEAAYIGASGDLALAGKLYPSDRGVLQTSKYIYYDGSSGMGGDFMRTNASGWGSGSYDFAEMFPSLDTLAAGEVVIFGTTNETVQRSSGAAYDDRIAGVVSTRPGFLAGDNAPGDVPIALAGRVPTYVSGENGDIAIGDPLTTSSRSGYAMKATEPGPIVGYAMEAFSGVTGVVTTFIRPSYFDGTAPEAPAADNTLSQVQEVATLDVSGSLNMNGGSILSVAALSGIGNNWRVDENGNFVTRGSITSLVHSLNGDDVETYAALGREHTIQLSGTSNLQGGAAHVTFADIDPQFSGVIAPDAQYRVLVTPAGMTGVLYVTERTNEGFVIRDIENTSGVPVDWLVIAYHKDYAPEQVVRDVIAPSATDETAGAAAEDALPTNEQSSDAGDAVTDVSVEDSSDTEDPAVVGTELASDPVQDAPVLDADPVAPTDVIDTTPSGGDDVSLSP